MKLTKTISYPVFLGLTHIGQIFSLCWSKKVGKCFVFDFDKNNLKKYKNKTYTDEEPSLKSHKFDLKRINVLKNEDALINAEVIFFTYDTPLRSNDGYPIIKSVQDKLDKLFKIKFKKKVKIIITSQFYPGYINFLKKKYLKNNKNIEIIYMVDTLKMGSAIDKFLYPEQLIFGAELKQKKFLLKLFKKFRCKKFLLKIEEAELLKISINLYLYFSVNFTNIMDTFSKQLNINFSNIIKNLRNDKRIGKFSYITPSPAISGGHLERDTCYLRQESKDKEIIKIFNNLEKFNSSRKIKIRDKIIKLTKNKKAKILIVGASYKSNSFSIVNNVFDKIFKHKNFKTYFYDSYFKLENHGINNIQKNISHGVKKADVIILNYCNTKDLRYLKNLFSNKKIKKFLVNFSFKNKKLFLDNNKVINYF
mgnify:CR=1 FL=1|tara:strand:- start:1384 stop:2646 length:1263 start_codon:yes stop_codon:yes gene_type:complete